MRADILQSKNSDEVRTYLQKKFKTFNSWTYSTNSRNKKCVQYYLCASDENKRLVEGAYFATFKASFPKDLATKAQADLECKAAGPVMVERSEWIGMQEDRQDSASGCSRRVRSFSRAAVCPFLPAFVSQRAASA